MTTHIRPVRTLTAGVFALALTTTLAACGGSDADPAAQAAPETASMFAVDGYSGVFPDCYRDNTHCITKKEYDDYLREARERRARESAEKEEQRRATRAASPTPTRSNGSATAPGTGSSASSLPEFNEADLRTAATGIWSTKGPSKHTADIDQRFDRPTAGGEIEYVMADGSRKVCTLAAMGKMPGGNLVALTAGHCARDAATDPVFYTSDTTTQPAGVFLPGWESGDASDKSVGDFGVLDIPDDYWMTSIRGTIPVSGTAGPTDLDPDTEVCKFGRSTGETCGKLMASEGKWGRAAVYSESGDSGSPLYVKDAGGSARIIGILHGSPWVDGVVEDRVSSFTWIDDAVAGTGVRLMTS